MSLPAVPAKEQARPHATPAVRRKRALAAAKEIAIEGGYEAVTMREVALRSGVARATLYRYFSSKDHLLAELILELNGAMRDELRLHPPTGITLAERVSDAFARVLSTIAREPKLLHATLRAFFSDDPMVRAAEPQIRRFGTIYLEAGLGDADIPGRAEIGRVLGPLSFAMLISMGAGRRTVAEAIDDMRNAVRLLIKG